MNREALNQWVIKQLNAQGMSMRELGRLTGLGHSEISKVLNDKREPGLDFYVKIAQAFDNVPDMLLVGEVLSPVDFDKGGENIGFMELWKAISLLDDKDRDELTNYVNYLLSKRKKGDSGVNTQDLAKNAS